KNSYIGVASRVGLTPSPTCQTWARWFPQGDAATSATKRVARDCQPSSDETDGGFFMSKRKSGGQAAGSPTPPEMVCILVVDAVIDEIEVEICCQRTNGVDRVFSTSMG